MLALISYPVRMFIGEVTFGVLSSGSFQQSEIARALKDLSRVHRTQKRL